METNRPANHSEYPARTFLPGDVVTIRNGRRPYLVVGVSYYGGEFRVDLRALGGAYKGSSASNMHARDLRASDKPAEVYGARASKVLEDLWWAMTSRCSPEQCKAAVGEHWGTSRSMPTMEFVRRALAVLREQYTAGAEG